MKTAKIGTVEINLSTVPSTKSEFKKKFKGFNFGKDLETAWLEIKEAKKKK